MCILLMTCLLSAGCWDAISLSELSIATMTILDKKDGEYYLYIEIARIGTTGSESQAGGSTGGERASVFLTGRGESIVEAREDAERQLDHPIFLATIRTLIITHRAAETDLEEYLFRLRSDPTYRQKLLLCTTTDEPEYLMQTESGVNAVIGFMIDDTLDSIIKAGQAVKRNTARYTENHLIKSAYLIPSMGVREKQIILKGYTVVDGHRAVGSIPAEESRSIVYMHADDPRWVYRIPLEENAATVEVRVSKKETVPQYKDGKISFELNYEFTGEVDYFATHEPKPLDKETEKILTRAVLEKLSAEFTRTLEQSQKEFQLDYLGFDHEFRMKYPDEFENMDWPSEFLKAEFILNFSADCYPIQRMDFEPE